jgi:Gas vesicle protein
MSPARRRPSHRKPTEAELVLGGDEATLLDIVDNVLSKGVVLTGELTIALAHVDLVYARLSLLLCAADRVMPGEDANPIARHSARHAARERVTRARGRG